MTRHRFGLHLTDFAHPAWGDGQLLPRLTSVCQALEESPAFDTLWLNDHLHHPGPEGPMAPRPEAMMLLAAAAVPTSTLRLGRLVARYADMCNLSAPAGDSLESIPHKLEVLERHCEAVGRDRHEIVVTYKNVMVVAGSEGAAREAWDAYRTPRGLPPGTPAFVG